MKNKKIIAVLAAFALSQTALLAGCGNKDAAVETSAAATEAESRAQASESEAKESETLSSYYNADVEKAEDGYERDQSAGGTIKYSASPTDFYEYGALDEATSHGAEAYLDKVSTELDADSVTFNRIDDGSNYIEYVKGKKSGLNVVYAVKVIGASDELSTYVTFHYETGKTISDGDIKKLLSDEYISFNKR